MILLFFGFLLMSFGLKHFNKLRRKDHIFDFLPKFKFDYFKNGVKPVFKNFTVLEPDMNLLSFLRYELIDGLKDEAMVFGGFGLTNEVKPEIISVKFLVALNVKVHFVEVNFELDLLPADFAVGFWVTRSFDASGLF